MAARALRAPLQLLAALVRPQQQRGFHASGPSGSLYFEELHAAPTAAAAAAPTAPSARRPCTIVALHGLLGSGRCAAGCRSLRCSGWAGLAAWLPDRPSVCTSPCPRPET